MKRKSKLAFCERIYHTAECNAILRMHGYIADFSQAECRRAHKMRLATQAAGINEKVAKGQWRLTQKYLQKVRAAEKRKT